MRRDKKLIRGNTLRTGKDDQIKIAHTGYFTLSTPLLRSLLGGHGYEVDEARNRGFRPVAGTIEALEPSG